METWYLWIKEISDQLKHMLSGFLGKSLAITISLYSIVWFISYNMAELVTIRQSYSINFLILIILYSIKKR